MANFFPIEELKNPLICVDFSVGKGTTQGFRNKPQVVFWLVFRMILISSSFDAKCLCGIT